MQFLAAALLFTSATSASLFSGEPHVLDEALAVPGENPLVYCETPKGYLLDIKNVDLDPNPPKAGNKLLIRANGTLSEKVEKGAKVNVSVKFGIIQIINLVEDLCDQVKQVNLECPLEKDTQIQLIKEVNLPAAIPPGKYIAKADAFTADQRTITCLSTTISFNLPGASRENL